MMILYILRGFSLILISCYSSEVTYAVTTEWPWPWHPDIHWYHEYLNLSSVGPQIWNGLYIGVSTGLQKYNDSHVEYKWIAQMLPNITALDALYYKEYEGTGKNLFACWPVLLGRYPDWFTNWDEIWSCGNYTPQRQSVRRTKEWSHLYTTKKPFVDICIAIGTVVTVVGIPGKLLTPHFTEKKDCC